MRGLPASGSANEAGAAIRPGLPRKWPAWALAAGIAALLLLLGPGYVPHLLVMFALYLLLAYSLNLVMGFGGLIVFCHGMFYGIGAYVYALARLRVGIGNLQAVDLFWAGNL